MLGLDTPVAARSISPVHKPALKLDVLTCTLKELGVAPDVGVTTSQLLPQVEVLLLALKLMLEPVLLVRERVCADGVFTPI
jgi:hypothetical protein